MKNIKSLLIVALLGTSFSSCNDFLTLDPLNDIVLENFWTDKSDVESVMLGAYSSFESSDCLLRMAVWGEMRSDNIVEGNGTSEDIRQICRENLLITNSYCKYDKFYDVINRANTVLHFAPIVADKDPNFTFQQLQWTEAEAIALRSLCYFYLIRAFHDVPFVTEPSIDDEGGHMKFYVPQSPFETVLDSIIGDLERVKDQAAPTYQSADAYYNRITKWAICAMLADMYLWRGQDGDLDKCIAVCEEVTARKKYDYEKLLREEGKHCTVSEFNGYPLISDAPENNPGNSYNEIFGIGNSFESIFELPYTQEVSNPFVGTYYQNNNSSDVGQIKAYEKIGATYGHKGDVFEQTNDVRRHVLKKYSSSYAICKYAYDDMDLMFNTGAIAFSRATVRNQTQAGWIVYRYSEVLLFEAEAYILKAKRLNPSGADSLAISDEVRSYKDKAFELIDAVNKRSIVADNSNATGSVPLRSVTGYNASISVPDLENILFNERRRELMFEGKRWFDLVRLAVRSHNQNALISVVSEKHDAATLSAVKIKLKNPYAMYFPLHKDEVRNSQKVLKQNPAYSEEEEIEQAH